MISFLTPVKMKKTQDSGKSTWKIVAKKEPMVIQAMPVEQMSIHVSRSLRGNINNQDFMCKIDRCWIDKHRMILWKEIF